MTVRVGEIEELVTQEEETPGQIPQASSGIRGGRGEMRTQLDEDSSSTTKSTGNAYDE